MQTKLRKYKILLIFFILVVLSVSFVLSATQVDLDKELENFVKTGVMSKSLVDNIGSLTASERGKIVDKIGTLAFPSNFWKQWTSFNSDTKRLFWKGLEEDKAAKFTEQYGKNYGVKITGFDKNIGFGEQGVVGSSKAYFDAEKIKKYNEKFSDKIVEVTYEKKDGKDTLVLKKQSGASAKVIAGENQDGYYIDVENGIFYRLKKQGENIIPDANNPLTGKWNGFGEITIDVSGNKPEISLGFLKKDGKPNENNYATFTTTTKDSYAPFQKPNGKIDEKGKPLYDLNDAKIVFNEDGKPAKMSDVYKYVSDPKKWGGFFGKDVSVFYSKEEFDKLGKDAKENLGSYIVVDEKTSYIEANVAREAKGLIADLDGQIKAIKDFIDGQESEITAMLKLGDVVGGIGGALNAVGVSGLSELNIQAKKNYIAGKLGLGADNHLVSLLANNPSLVESVLKNAKGYLGAGELFASLVSSGLEASSSGVDYPLLKTLVPSQDSVMQIQLGNEFAKNIENVDIKAGTFSIADDRGVMTRIVDKATLLSPGLVAEINKYNPYFSGINFNLINSNNPDLRLQVYSFSSGRIEVIGSKSSFENFASRTLVGTGTATGRIISVTKSEQIAQFGLQVDSETAKKAKEYFDSSSKAYDKRYYELAKGGISAQENQELLKLAQDINRNYYGILAQGNSKFYLSSGQIPGKISEIAGQLDALSSSVKKGSLGTGSMDDIANSGLTQSIVSQYLSDPVLKGQISQRGITSESAIRNVVANQISKISNFLKSNPSSYFEVVSDSKNNLYQIRAGSGRTLNLDTLSGPVVKALPMVVGSGGVKNGNFYISSDFTRGRLVGNQQVNFYGSYYGILLGHAGEAEATIRYQIQNGVVYYATNPS